jgi:hypothetical protein
MERLKQICATQILVKIFLNKFYLQVGCLVYKGWGQVCLLAAELVVLDLRDAACSVKVV